MVTLAGGGTDPEGAPLTFAWTQVLGPSVGALSGPQPTFTAPGTAGTLSFDLVVSDGVHNSTPDRVSVAVLSCSGAQDVPDSLFADTNCDGIDGDIARAIFVAVSGNDANPGTMAQPVATVAQGIALAGTTKSVYVSRGTYSVGQLQLASGVNLYGLFDASAGWSRAAGNITRLEGGTTALRAQALTSETHVEGFHIVAAPRLRCASSYGIRVQAGTGRLFLRTTPFRPAAAATERRDRLASRGRAVAMVERARQAATPAALEGEEAPGGPRLAAAQAASAETVATTARVPTAG